MKVTTQEARDGADWPVGNDFFDNGKLKKKKSSMLLLRNHLEGSV